MEFGVRWPERIVDVRLVLVRAKRSYNREQCDERYEDLADPQAIHVLPNVSLLRPRGLTCVAAHAVLLDPGRYLSDAETPC